MENLKELLNLLIENDIDFVLIGGFAGVVHGTSSVTQDIDICATLTKENIENLRKILKPYKPKHRMTVKKLSFENYPKNLEGINNLYLDTKLGQLDILSNVIGVGDFNLVKKNSIEISLHGHKCRVISINDLIKSKKCMNREKDKAILEELNYIISKSRKK